MVNNPSVSSGVSHSKWKAHNPNGIFYPKFCLPLAQFQIGWVFHINGKQPMFSFSHCVISRLGNYTNTLLLVGWAKKQYTRDDEPTIVSINQDKNIDNEVYIMSASSSITFLCY
jgi:hypothetical protein